MPAILRWSRRLNQTDGVGGHPFFLATDDAYLLEWMGHPVKVLEGSGENIKVTRPEDMILGEAILSSRAAQGT